MELCIIEPTTTVQYKVVKDYDELVGTILLMLPGETLAIHAGKIAQEYADQVLLGNTVHVEDHFTMWEV